MGRRPHPSGALAATSDLFAHFGIDLVGPPEPASRVQPAAACPRCAWLCVALPCPICGHLRTPRLRRAADPR